MEESKIKESLENLLFELNDKKNEIKNYLIEMDHKIKIIQLELEKINKKQNKIIIQNDIKPNNQHRMVHEYSYSGDEYDSDDSCDRIYLMDLPKLFENH